MPEPDDALTGGSAPVHTHPRDELVAAIAALKDNLVKCFDRLDRKMEESAAKSGDQFAGIFKFLRKYLPDPLPSSNFVSEESTKATPELPDHSNLCTVLKSFLSYVIGT